MTTPSESAFTAHPSDQCAEAEHVASWRAAMGPQRNPSPFSNQASAYGQGFREGMKHKYDALVARPCQNCGGHTSEYWAKHAAPPSGSVAAPSPVGKCVHGWDHCSLCAVGFYAGPRPEQAPQAERFGPPDGVFASESGDAPQAEATPPEPDDECNTESDTCELCGLVVHDGDAVCTYCCSRCERIVCDNCCHARRGPGVLCRGCSKSKPPPPDDVIRAAEGVTLEPGEYETVDAHAGVEPIRFTVRDRSVAFMSDGKTFRFYIPERSYFATAVRRVAPESAAKPPAELYVPKPNERVRVVELMHREIAPSHGVGYVGESAYETSPGTGGEWVGWLCLHTEDRLIGTWCRVVPAPLTEPEPVSESGDEAVGAARHYKARGLLDVSADIGPDAMAQMDRIIENMGPDLARLMPGHLPAHWEALTKERNELRSKVSELEEQAQGHADADGVWQSMMEIEAAKLRSTLTATEAKLAELTADKVNLDKVIAKLKEQHDGCCEANANYVEELHMANAELARVRGELELANDKLFVDNKRLRGALLDSESELASEQRACTQLHCNIANAWSRFRDSSEGDASNELWDELQRISASNPHASTETPAVAAPAVVQGEPLPNSVWRWRPRGQ